MIMIIIKNSNNINHKINIEQINQYLLNSHLLENDMIYIYNENDIHQINFNNFNGILHINYCDLLNIPDNIPTQIKELYLNYNQINNANLINFNYLQKLNISHNNLSTLIIPNCIKHLECQCNNLTYIDIYNHPYLKYIDISNNSLINPLNNQNNNEANSLLIIENNYSIISFYEHDILPEYQPLFTIHEYQEEYREIEIEQYLMDIIENDPLEEDTLKQKYQDEINIIIHKQIQIPDNFICPITKDIFYNPVTLSDGHTYEKYEITQWIKHHNNSPLTNQELEYKELYHNYTLKKIIREWIEINKK